MRGQLGAGGCSLRPSRYKLPGARQQVAQSAACVARLVWRGAAPETSMLLPPSGSTTALASSASPSPAASRLAATEAAATDSWISSTMAAGGN